MSDAKQCANDYLWAMPTIGTLALVVSVVAVLVAYNAIKTNRKISEDKTIADRKTAKLKNTADILVRWREDDKVRKGLQVLRDWHNNPETSVSVLATSSNNKDDLNDLRYLLNFMEDIAAGVKHDIYDEQFLRSSIRSIVRNTWTMAKPFIESVRAKEKNNAYYEHLERLKNIFEN